jgi:hypothetical protein
MKTQKTARVAASFAFTALLFSMLGAALLETLQIRAHAWGRLHLLTASIDLIIVAIAFRRLRLWSKIFDAAVPSLKPVSQRRFDVRDLGPCLGLVTAGCVLALSAKAGSFAFFAICAGAFSFAPWSRIDLCRSHCFISCAMVGAGAASVVAAAGSPQAPIIYLIWTWVLHFAAVVALLATYRSLKTSTGGSVTGGSVEAEPFASAGLSESS